MKLAILVAVLFSLTHIKAEYDMLSDLRIVLSNNTHVSPKDGFHQGISSEFSCTCNDQTLTEIFPNEYLKTDHRDVDFSNYCAIKNTTLCEFSKTCDNCTQNIKNCSRLSQRENISSECFYRSVAVHKDRPLLTKISGPARNRRQLYLREGCLVPNEMKTAELKCHVYSKYIKCRQTCMYGYTLDGGISRDLKCIYKDKKWSGQGFKECLPFVDCTLTLTTGGQLSCVKNTVNKPPHCDVSCFPYEDKPGTSMKRYTCTTEPNKWNPALPHCVSPGSGFDLVPAPRIKDHLKEVFEPEVSGRDSKSKMESVKATKSASV